MEGEPVGEERGIDLSLREGLLVMLLLKRLSKWSQKTEDPDRPQIISLDGRSKTVLERAKQFARDGRDDQDAVAELRALARSKRKLRKADRATRFRGLHHERRVTNLSHRLLEAAATGQPVAPVTAEDQERIEAVESLIRLSPQQQWARLVQLQPTLPDLEAAVRAGEFGARPGWLAARHEALRSEDAAVKATAKAPIPEQEQEQLHEYYKHEEKLLKRMRTLVGPESQAQDPLIESLHALLVTHSWLRQHVDQEIDPAAARTRIT
jgi:hypothetical protein